MFYCNSIAVFNEQFRFSVVIVQDFRVFSDQVIYLSSAYSPALV